jgi:hypothetical protein
MEKENSKILEKLTTYLFYLFAFLFFLSFNFQDSRSGGWYQQFLPNLNGRSISDITFLDSLTGYAVANSQTDTNYILKTTNGGDNWIILSRRYNLLQRVQFLNLNTGFVCGSALLKTTNQGLNWLPVNTSGISAEGMWVISYDTIWIIDQESLTGGAFLTTNGGVSWQQKYSNGTENPNEIYFYNSRIGFISGNPTPRVIRKTTDGGNSWSVILNNDYFDKMYFYDSLLGWKCSSFGMKKTTNGGINWISQTLPTGGIITSLYINFSNVNKDTIWTIGGYILYPNNQIRQVLFRTTNGGTNWFYQIPDTTIQTGQYWFINFINKRNGWVTPKNYPASYNSEIHTTVGGDTTFLSSINQISFNVPNEYRLYQNYPNPFNPSTSIKYKVEGIKNVKLILYDILGKEITILNDKKQTSGSYEVKLDGSNLSSGVYFYSLFIDGERVDTKKAVLLK